MPKKRSVCPRYSKKLQRMSKRLRIPQSPVADAELSGGHVFDGEHDVTLPALHVDEFAPPDLKQITLDMLGPDTGKLTLADLLPKE